MNKRGVSSMVITIGVILIAIAAGSTLFAFGKTAAEGRVFDSRILAEDLILTINAACLDPNSLYATYNINKGNYIINIQNGIITIRIQGDDKILLRDEFSPEFCKNVDSNFLEYGFDEIIFYKTGNRILLESDFPFSITAVSLTDKGFSPEDFVWPSESRVITSCYGDRDIQIGSKFHEGIDIRSSVGQKVFAAAAGKVLSTSVSSGIISIDHGNMVISKYYHLNKTNVKNGDLVKKGDVIADSGTTNTKDPHLDFRISVEGVFVDPLSTGIYDPNNFNYKQNDIKSLDSNCHYNIDNYAYQTEIQNNLIRA